MQVVTTPLRAWSWLENTSYGVEHFANEKLKISHDRVNAIINEQARKGIVLRDLTPYQHENNALVFYGPGGNLGNYYVLNEEGTDWIVNFQGNPIGIDYADLVRQCASGGACARPQE